MASVSLLSYVAGIGPKLAERIVEYRDANGRFDSRASLLKVPKLGPKAFEQAAGFLRIRNGAAAARRLGGPSRELRRRREDGASRWRRRPSARRQRRR